MMWRTFATACAVIGCLAMVRTESQAEPVVHAFAGKERFAILRAIDGALRRLATPDCQRLFDDFTDREGRTLAENLVTLGRTPRQFFNELYFTEDRVTPCCLNRGTLAFTAPGHRVIRVCPRFSSVAMQNVSFGDATLIHEMLHALGLGENPPKSSDITRQVLARCS
jgi:hypothetical protein